jgi:predicted SAM-dependent methyltransferase
MKKVQLGCGNNRFPGWTNVDLEPGADIIMDLSKGNLPFASGEIDFIYSEHFIEHITREQGIALFVECARTLKAGGTMRLSTPDLLTICSDYQGGKLDRWETVGWVPLTPCQLVNGGLRLWQHQFVYDFDELKANLLVAGFSIVTKQVYRESSSAELKGLETRPYCEDLIVEAIK